MRLICLLALFLSSTYSSTFTQVLWQRTNGPLGGDLGALVMTNSGAIVAGTFSGGIYRSIDGGQTWSHIEDTFQASFLFLGVEDLKKNSQGHLFAATSGGVYRSTDDGVSWTPFESGLTDRIIRALAINSIDVIFAGSNQGGIFRSEDNGETWVAFNNGLTDMRMRSVAINSLGDIFAGTRNGLFFSNDNGDNWTTRSSGIENEDVLSLFVTPDDSLLVGSFNGAFRSADHGVAWTQVIMSDPIHSFAINSSNSLFAGSSGGFIYRSSDNGLRWQTTGNELISAFFKDLLFTPSGDLLAASLSYGILLSSNNGGIWSRSNNGLTATDVQSMTITQSGDVFAVTEHGAYRTTDGGDTWIWLFDPDEGLQGKFITNNAGRLFAGFEGFVGISDDNGEIWTLADSSLTGAFSIALSSAGDIYVGGDGRVLKSPDNGETWGELTTGFPNNRLQAIGVSNSGTVFAGTESDGVFRSVDAGTTWVEVSTGLGQNLDITAFLPQANGDVLLSAFDGVFRTSNNGDTWVKTGNVPTLGVEAIAQDSDGNLYIGMRGGGVAFSEDDGATWSNTNNGHLHKDARALLIDTGDNIYVGTLGGGVFRGIRQPVSVDTDDEILPGGFVLKQNYPNPFNPSTTISFEVPVGSQQKITLTVFDVLGRRVKVLVNETLAAGSHTIAWNGRDQWDKSVASGVYLYQLKAGNTLVAKKLILMR